MLFYFLSLSSSSIFGSFGANEKMERRREWSFPPHVHNQNLFSTREVSCNKDTSINILSLTHKRGKILEFFLEDTVKTTF